MPPPEPAPGTLDPVLLSVLSNRLDGIVREMSNTLLKAARSAVIAVARDFSCAICTADNQLLATAEGLPVHIFGSHLQTRAMTDLHGDLAEGDAFLHNDPYLGNTHPADHAVLVPVFIDGEHLFTACAKGHQADIGNSIPTTYHAAAKDVYEEGSLIFPCVRVQRGYDMVDDVIRMCRRRIRVPEQWYGDFLAELGAARIAERRLKELCDKYGKETIKTFIREWFDYSERRMVQAIQALPEADVSAEGAHDPFEPFLPRRHPHQGRGPDRTRCRPHHHRPARQHRLRRLRPERIGGLRHQQRGGRTLQLPGPRDSAQRRVVPARGRAAARRLRRRPPVLPPFDLDGHHQRRRPPGQHHPFGDGQARATASAWRRAAAPCAPPRRC